MLLAVFAANLPAEPGLARSSHFEVYAQAGPASARSLALDFERLRAYFLQQTGLQLDNRPPVRVIAFRSRAEYLPYRLQPATDAYYVGADSRDTIVMTAPEDGQLRVAAHEYAHFVLHANGLELPPWLNEGLSELFSTVRLNGPDRRDHPERPARAAALRNRTWMPLSELVTLPADSSFRELPGSVDLFYAESWALTDMLANSPQYRSHFPDLVSALSSSHQSSDRALAVIYGKPLDAIAVELHVWVEARRITPISLPGVAPASAPMEVSETGPLIWQSVTADLLLAIGRLDEAAAGYEALAREAPTNPDFQAALAIIALEKHDWNAARKHWANALAFGVQDAAVCYQYAGLADAAGLSRDDVRPALERALSIQPQFDNAHYKLALLDSNAGRYESAVLHLRALHAVAPARQFAYWSALSYALSELGRREEAQAAAHEADQHAATPEEHARAAQLSDIADTELSVRFSRDAAGHPKLVTTRIPYNTPNWNPFIEPDDHIRRVDGTLRALDCEGSPLQMQLDTATGPITLVIPDPLRVQMRNAPKEFTCGPQPNSPVTVVYALSEASHSSRAGIIRGMEFH